MAQIITLQEHIAPVNLPIPETKPNTDPKTDPELGRVEDHSEIVAIAARYAVHTCAGAVFTPRELSDHLVRNAAVLPPPNTDERLQYLGVVMTDAWARAKDTANRLGERPPTIIRIKGENGWDNLVGIVVPTQPDHPENTLTEPIQTTKPITKPAAIETPPSTTAGQIDFAHAVLDIFVHDNGSNPRLLDNIHRSLKTRGGDLGKPEKGNVIRILEEIGILTQNINRRGGLSYQMPPEVQDDLRDMLAAHAEREATSPRGTTKHPWTVMLETVFE